MYSPIQKMAGDLVCQVSHWRHRKRFRQLRYNSGEYSLQGFDRLKCIFIHIPKAAGISINKALFGNYGGGHETVRRYKQIFGPRTYREYFSFTFVRNPYSRILSAYRFLKAGGFSERDKTWAEVHLANIHTFDEFVRTWLDEKSLSTQYHFRPQYSFICDTTTKPEVDFIGKFESIEEDFETVCQILKVENKLSMNNKGSRDNSHWNELYTKYALDKVYDLYRRDFETLGYEKPSL